MMQRIGRLIGRYPWIFLISSFIFVLPFLSFFILKPIRLETDIRRGFAPKNGRALEEFKAFLNYRSNVDNVELAVVLVEAPEGKDKMLLNMDLVQELEALSQEVDGINISHASNASQISLKDVRGKSNYLFEIFMQMFQAKNDSIFGGDDFVKLQFPVCEVMGNKFNMGGHFFGVTLYPENEWSEHESSIKSIEAIALWYIFDIPSKDTTRMDIVKKLLIKLFDKSKEPPSHGLFRYHIYADKVANEEMSRGSRETVNLLIFGLLLMLAFMCISMWSLKKSTKLILIPAAVLTPLLAAATTFGLIGWCGFAYNSIMSVAPFLLLGIGVDDAFLLLHCWRKYRKQKGYTVENEMGLVVSEVGPSILITSVTNCMAFGVGFFAPSEALSSFCLCTSIAVLIDFIFEFTIFAACLSIISRKSHNENISSGPATIDGNLLKDSNTLLPQISRSPKAISSPKNSKLMNYCKFVASKKGKILAVFIIGILYISSYFGLMKMKTTFEPQKTFPLNSRLQSSMKIIEKVLEQYSPINFVVNNPPNITDPADYQNFLKFVEEMEALPETYGPDWTQLFLRDYISFDKSLYIENPNETFSYLPTFDNLEKYAEERGIAGMKVFNYHTNPYRLKSFLFVIVCHGKRSWHDRAYFIEKIRAITDKYSQYKVTVFDYDATIFDLIITVKWEMMKAVLITLICMSVVCFIIIPSIFYTGIALLSIISIAFTLVGVLGWWGSDLDPVTMINVLMAIGFSVDFCAHVCYHYFKYCNKTFDASPKSTWDFQRLYLIMNAVGRPTLEAALSTMICMIPLFFIDVYIVQCFAKTVVCVGSLGILHGLFLIPVALSSKDSFSIAKENGSSGSSSAKSLCSSSTADTESAATVAEMNQML